MRNILLSQTALLTNDIYEVFKRKPVVGYDFRKAWTCNFLRKEALAQVLTCEICEIFKNTLFTEHHRKTASMAH